MNNEFDVIPISETWWNDDSINLYSLYQIPSYIPIRQIRKMTNQGGVLTMYTHKTIAFKILEKLRNNNKHTESLSIEIIRKNQMNVILSCIYRPPRGEQNIFSRKTNDHSERYKQNQKSLLLVGCLNLNSRLYNKQPHSNIFNRAF